MQTRRRRRRHQRVVTRVELHLINAVAETVVALELRREHIGQPGVLLHLGAAHLLAQRLQWRRVQRRRVETQGVLHGPVAIEQVHIHQRLGLVEDFVGCHDCSCCP
jgi:hypothetical protein